MGSEGASLLDKYSFPGAEQADKSAAAIHNQVVAYKPEWEKYSVSQQNAQLLKLLDVEAPALKTLTLLKGNVDIMKACMDALAIKEERPLQWMLTLLHDMLREDSTCYTIFEEAMQNKIDIFTPLFNVLKAKAESVGKTDTYAADNAAWVLSAVMGHVPNGFDLDKVKSLVKLLTESSDPACSDLGAVEAIANILKSDKFRAEVWKLPGVPDRVFGVQAKTASSPMLYKCVFAMWMLSFDKAMLGELILHRAVKKIRSILAISRVEKVVRMCLTVLKSILQHKQLCEEVVEANVLDAVQSLEYEKWRDAELYDDIREMSSLISAQVQEMSNFARYEKELHTGSLSWGFIHTSKFWAENVMKFETNDFKALKTLATLLFNPQTDSTTLAVACHDVGEFVALHPLGKKKVAQLHIKERVMELMGSVGDDKREVRREALLCCQKIMLNKWQDIEKGK